MVSGLLVRLPSGRIGRSIRFTLARFAKAAPLSLAIARGDTVVQVGAVAAGDIWRMVDLVGPSGRVVVVEPFPEEVELIERRLRERGIANVTVIGKGAWSERGAQTLYVHPHWHDSNIILDAGTGHDRALAPEQYADAIEIEVDRLDDLLAASGVPEPDFVKITVMGAELQVLEGMDRLLSGRTRLWVKGHSLVSGRPANEIIAPLLRARGFRTVTVRGNRGPDGRRRPGDVYAVRLG